MKRFENVRCYYTGGGIYVYSALFNGEVWLYGGLDNYFGSYDLSGETIEEFHGCNYDAHWKKPSIPYPRWYEILESIHENCDMSTYVEAERILNHYNPGPRMFDRCIGDDDGTDPKGDKTMTKAEIIERIVDSFWDFSSEDPENYLDMDPITLDEATMYLEEARGNERAADLEPDECLPAETTPELYMEAENCYIRMMRHDAHVLRLASWLTTNECVCEYNQFRNDYQHEDPEVLPSDWLFNEYEASGFPFKITDDDAYNPDLAFIFKLGMRSAKTFMDDDEYMWFNRKEFRLETTSTPFADGIIHAEPFARFILGPDGHEALTYFLDSLMDDDEIRKVFGCDVTEVKSFYSLS